MSEDEDLKSDRIGGERSIWRFRGIRRRLVLVRQFGREMPRMWPLHDTRTLPRWLDRLPAIKLRYRLRPMRGKVCGYSVVHYGDFMIFRRLNWDA
jgi:hypothetical protein